MSDITPEILKVVAEGMGYKRVNITPAKRLVVATAPNQGETCGAYQPHLTNDEQCMEIMEKLPFDQSFELIGDGIWKAEGFWKVQYIRDGFVAESKNLNEAIVLAAYEYFKDK